jgi:hypothetical protein
MGRYLDHCSSDHVDPDHAPAPLIPEGKDVLKPGAIVDAGLLILAFILHALVTYTVIAWTMFKFYMQK